MSGGHWTDISGRWSQVGQPLRPSEQDLATFTDFLGESGPVRGLIFGVTPEILHLPWPAGSDVRAVDNNLRMIDNIWKGDPNQVVCGDWRALPLRPNSRDVVFCDGGFHLVSYPDGQMNFVKSVRSVLDVDGVCAIRLFVPPEQAESPSTVLEDLLSGRVRDLNILKLRLGMAMQRAPSSGVRLGDVWEAISALGEFDRLANKVGWPLEHLRSIDSYRDSDSRYCFVSPREVEELFTARVGGFNLMSITYPSYELGERCPVIAFRKVN